MIFLVLFAFGKYYCMKYSYKLSPKKKFNNTDKPNQHGKLNEEPDQPKEVNLKGLMPEKVEAYPFIS